MTTNQNSSQRHQTSVFSEYENNSNNSVSSKQLELWLQQMAPTSHTSPKFGQDWNLMSTSSRYESDGMTFGARMDTFESANKENILSKANFIIEPSKSFVKQNHYQSLSQPQNSQKVTSSKSYINAMKQLQKRAKTLEQDNTNMRKSLQIFQQQKRNSLQSSMVESQELKSKIQKYEETQKRIEEMKRQNKKLRDSKNEQSLKVKLMQKSINEQKMKVKTFEQRLETLSKENEDLKIQLVESSNMNKSLLMENKQLAVKTETLENMKEKSTNSILEKYAKALERIEQLELTVGELKTKGSSIEERHKKIVEEKDGKHFVLLETINGLKLEKEQLSMRFENSNFQLDQRAKQLQKLQSRLRSLEKDFSEQSKQILTLKNMILQKDQKLVCLTQKQTKLEAKYQNMKEKMKLKQKRHQEGIRLLKQKTAIVEDEECKSESEQSIISDQLNENQEQYTNMSHLVEQKHKQEETPVQRYDQTSPGLQNTQLEEFTTQAKPFSIIINAKNLQPKIKSQQAEGQDLNNQPYQISEEQDSFEYQKYIKVKNTSHPISKFIQPKQPSNRKSITFKEPSQENKNINQQKSTSKDAKQPKSISKQSANSASNSRKHSIKESKYNIPASNFKKTKNQPKPLHNNSTLSSHNRSKSSSVQKKKNSQPKTISMDSKRKSISQKKSPSNTAERPNQIIKSSEPAQSRYVNDRPHQTHMYMSAEPTRYQIQHPQHYYYTNQINAKNSQEEQRLHYHNSFQHQNTSIHDKSMISRSETEVKKALNKALLLEYQEEALKLYEQHQKLLSMSENEEISAQQKAEILGRTRQVMSMIDHNTEKIFNLKGRAD